MSRVQALLEYSSAQIVSRAATGNTETWDVEGLVQPGLKVARFSFAHNALEQVELDCQYETWPGDRYQKRLEELRSFFDARFGEEHRVKQGAAQRNTLAAHYTWRVGETTVQVVHETSSSPGGQPLAVNSLIIRYRGRPEDPGQNPDSRTDPWAAAISSPVVRRKTQSPAEGSDFNVSAVKLLNATDSTQTAYVLQLSVRLQADAAVDASRASVQVNFYDLLPDQQIVLTDAQVNYDWPTRRDWKEANPENLSVTYIRKNDNQRSTTGPKFYGYIAAVYYSGQLESARAEPVSLMNLFPVRTFTSPFEQAQSAAGRGDYREAARIYRTVADRGNLFALENLAWFYAHGRGVPKDARQAAVFYERAALQNTPRSLNALAWFLATCDDTAVRNGPEAIRQATKACELSYWQEWKYIDTLAAGWAETGDFKRAIEYEQQALGFKNLAEQDRNRLQERLVLYQKRQRVRE